MGFNNTIVTPPGSDSRWELQKDFCDFLAIKMENRRYVEERQNELMVAITRLEELSYDIIKDQLLVLVLVSLTKNVKPFALKYELDQHVSISRCVKI